jgi:hypothetical protein
MNGFRACGIFPLNKNAIPDNAFMPSSVSDVPAVTDTAAADLPSAALAGPFTGTPSIETTLESAEITSPVTQPVTEVVTQLTAVVTVAASSDVPRTDAATLPSSEVPAVTASCTPTKVRSLSATTTFADLHPTPKIIRTRRAGGKKYLKKYLNTHPDYGI